MKKTKNAQNHEKRKVPCEVYSRIVGYMTPVQRWNDGKLQEFAERKTFDRAIDATGDAQRSVFDVGVFRVAGTRMPDGVMYESLSSSSG